MSAAALHLWEEDFRRRIPKELEKIRKELEKINKTLPRLGPAASSSRLG